MSGALTAASMLTGFKVILSGTAGIPNQDGSTSNAGWSFQSDGDLTKVSGGAHNKPEWYGRQGDTVHQTPDQTYYIRATLDSGTTPNSGPALGSWHALSSNRTWTWSTVAPAGVLKIEIASDAGGTDIVATGYYEGEKTV